MDTSDSECFESADEELYSEDESKKCVETKHVLKVTEDLIKLNVMDRNKKLNEDKSNKNLDATLLVNDNLINQNMHESVEIEDSNKDNEMKVKEIIQKSAEIIEDLVELKDISSKSIDTDEVNIEKESSSEENQSELSQLKQTNSLANNPVVSHSEKCIKTNILSATNSEDENMWDNNDWEPIVDKKESVCSVKNNIKPTESTSNDNTWENDWEPIQDSKDDTNKGSTNIDTDNENMWDNDDWEPFEKIENFKSYPKENKPENSWSGWGNWGVSSILTTATQGVSTLTNQVSQSLSTVLESGIGIPDPKELARQDKIVEKLDDPPECDNNKQNIGFGFSNLSNLVSGVSHFVETTGSKVITGGLDTLETIGKKTMEVLQEGDPGLKNKRALLKIDTDKPILSQVLREAKERSEKENKALLEVHAKKKLNYEILFDDYHGLVHLEALEMLSKQCDIKLQVSWVNEGRGRRVQKLGKANLCLNIPHFRFLTRNKTFFWWKSFTTANKGAANVLMSKAKKFNIFLKKEMKMVWDLARAVQV